MVVSPRASRAERAVVDKEGKTEGEPADLQGSRDFLSFFFIWGIECVWCVRPRLLIRIVKWSVCRVAGYFLLLLLTVPVNKTPFAYCCH